MNKQAKLHQEKVENNHRKPTPPTLTERGKHKIWEKSSIFCQTKDYPEAKKYLGNDKWEMREAQNNKGGDKIERERNRERKGQEISKSFEDSPSLSLSPINSYNAASTRQLR